MDRQVSMDESGSMNLEQEWLPPTITQIVSGLEDEGIVSIVCITGYESSGRSLGCSFFDSSMNYESTFGEFVLSGGTEDGWHGIDFAVDEATEYLDDNSATVDEECSDVVKMVILVTDEDRDNAVPTLTFEGIDEKLKDGLWILNVIVNIISIGGVSSSDVIGIAADGGTFVHSGGGAYATMPAGTVDIDTVDGDGTTETDYLPLAWDNFGVAWDLNRLRDGGDVATAFSSAFVDIKVQEIVIQTMAPTTSAPTASPAPSAATPATEPPAAVAAPTKAPAAVPVAAPTMTPTPPLPRMRGDPHVHTQEGRRVDIYLPLGIWSPLLAGDRVAMTGHVFARANKDDTTTQWFDGIRVVEANDTTKVLFEARIPHDIELGTVGPDGTYVQYIRASLGDDPITKTNATYTSPPLTVKASKMTSHVRGGRRPIYNDRLYVTTPDFEFTLENSRETNRDLFDSLQEQLAETHLNLAFKRVPFPETLSGPLAELMWPRLHETRSEQARAFTSKTNAFVAGDEA